MTDATVTRSRLGGVPIMPANIEWPRRAWGVPLHFIAQLDLGEVPRCSMTGDLPRDGALLFFYDGEDMGWGYEGRDADGFKVLFVDADAPRSRRVPPADTPDDFVRPTSGVTFVVEGSLDLDLTGLDEAARERVAARLSEGPSHRLLGEPEAIQNDPREDAPMRMRGEDWLLLLQVDSGEPLDFEFGDSGRIYFVVRREDLKAGRWDNVWCVLQCY